ncbi:unnamed protein product [Amoebophrya sp. A25]|nr:unnamed protein product [Amoebophrya sp. A25]|eukprot:GSA25T00019607001.1
MLLGCYLAYAVAQILDLSGIVALFIAGVVFGAHGTLSKETHRAAEIGLGVLSLVSECLVFFYLGVVAVMYTPELPSLRLLMGSFLLIFLARAVHVVALSFLLNSCTRTRSLWRTFADRVYQTVRLRLPGHTDFGQKCRLTGMVDENATATSAQGGQIDHDLSGRGNRDLNNDSAAGDAPGWLCPFTLAASMARQVGRVLQGTRASAAEREMLNYADLDEHLSETAALAQSQHLSRGTVWSPGEESDRPRVPAALLAQNSSQHFVHPYARNSSRSTSAPASSAASRTSPSGSTTTGTRSSAERSTSGRRNSGTGLAGAGRFLSSQLPSVFQSVASAGEAITGHASSSSSIDYYFDPDLYDQGDQEQLLNKELPWKSQMLIILAGLRGAISFALSLRVPDAAARAQLVPCTIFLVVITTIGVGSVMEHFVGVLGFLVDEDDETTRQQSSYRQMQDNSSSGSGGTRRPSLGNSVQPGGAASSSRGFDGVPGGSRRVASQQGVHNVSPIAYAAQYARPSGAGRKDVQLAEVLSQDRIHYEIPAQEDAHATTAGLDYAPDSEHRISTGPDLQGGVLIE